LEAEMEARTIVERSDGGTDELRARLRGMWSSVAAAWQAQADYVDTRGAAVTERMLELTRPESGERALELACGPGSVGLAVAPQLAPSGQVTLSDVVPEMTAIAGARAAAQGLENVSTKVLDLEAIDEPDGSYDLVFCREGLMLVPDPARGAREMRRVLRPGGRLALAVWGPRERNPWLAVVFDTASAQLGGPVPPPGIPHPFSLDDPDRLATLLEEAKLADVVVEELPTPYLASSFDEWWGRSVSLAGPLAQRLAALPKPAADALRARAGEAARPYVTSDGLEFPGVSLVASARRP
jgi:ubiquinone/menaquinone biosynthesis C-methylase UbiE